MLKQGKSRTEINSYRPIAFIFHVGKRMKKIILSRLSYFCKKNRVIVNQARFHKGRSAIDQLVNLTIHVIKIFLKSVSKRKSVLATFFFKM